MKTRTLLTLLFLIQLPCLLQAGHILGGQMSYQHIAGNTYLIELTIFRDCAGIGAPFDAPASIAVYSGNNAPYNFIQDYGQLPATIEVISANQESCYSEISPFCTEIGIYNYELTLPDPNEIYHIIYQRCCRSIQFSNVANLEETGFTIAIEINTKAQELENDSPQLNSNPLFEICFNVPFEIDFSATDSNADSLVYELCHPITGGGPFGTANYPGDPSACDGVQPIPACPPPFELIDFNSVFSTNDPLGSTSDISIDRNSGLISGNAIQLGQFLTGVCITEYVDGEIASFSQQELVFRVNLPTSVEEYPVEKLSVFPNPATNQLSIKLPSENERYNLMIRDLNGKVVNQLSNIGGSQLEIDTTNLNGVYLLELKTDKTVYVQRVLIL